jgi:hypothetical protein
VARAGIVVSRVVTAVQDATPRRGLAPWGATPTLSIGDIGADFQTVQITFPMVSHMDLMEEHLAEDWKANSPPEDVVWWPDPDVTYTLLRYHGDASAPAIEEEDAVVRLVAAKDAGDPVVVRCRGTRFDAGDADVASHAAGGGRSFHLTFSLKVRKEGADAGVQRLRLTAAEAEAGAEVVKAFNGAGSGVARIFWPLAVEVQADCTNVQPASLQEYLRRAADRLEGIAGAAQPRPPDAVLGAIKKIAAEMRTEADQVDAAHVDGKVLANLGRMRRERLECDSKFEFTSSVEDPAIRIEIKPVEGYLELTALPSDDVVKRWKASLHPVANDSGRLWGMCRERLLGAATGILIRAVDTRNALPVTIGDKLTIPGEATAVVRLPEWPGK